MSFSATLDGGGRPRSKRVGHKGADLIAPGNTRESFAAALEHGVDMIEFDVLPERIDGSGRLLLAHDYTAASCGTPLSLDEGLEHFAQDAYAGVELDVDMKLPGYEARVVEALRRHGLAERALISTMEWESLELLREIAPDIRIGWSFPRVRQDYTKHPLYRYPAFGVIGYYRLRLPGMATRALIGGKVDALMCHWAFVTARLARAVADAGGELYVWTVDDRKRIAALERLGVAGVITNDPRLFDRA